MTTPTASLRDTYAQIFGPQGFVAQMNVEREEPIALAGQSLISGTDLYLLGDPGVGKTYMLELILQCLRDGTNPARLFDLLLMKDMSADDLLGPRSLPALKEGRLERVVDGFLPTAHLAYLDEWDKGNPTALNALLDVTSKRMLKVGAQRVDCSQLLAIFFSGNAMPEREDLLAITDRIGVKYYVKPVRSPEARKAVMGLQIAARQRNGQLPSSAPTLSIDEIAAIKDEVRQIDVPAQVLDSLDEAVEKWGQEGFPPSARKVGNMLRMMQARAWTRGSSEVQKDDLLVTAHMAWNHPDNARAAYDIVAEFASEWTRRAKRARDAMEPIVEQANELKRELEAAGSDDDAVNAALESGISLIRDLRRLKRETKQQVKQGTEAGEDVVDLQTVLDEIVAMEDWTTGVFTGEAEDQDGSPE